MFEFGIDRFGLEQALHYQNGLKQRFKQIAQQPELYQAMDYIRPGYRRSVYEAHSIFYKLIDGDVLIIRILGRENIETAFSQ